MAGKDQRRTAALTVFIRNALKERKMSAAELSRRMGLSRDAIRDIERGSVPGITKIRYLASALNVPVEDLLSLLYPQYGRSETEQPLPRDRHRVDDPMFRATAPVDIPLYRQGPLGSDGLSSDILVTHIQRVSPLDGRDQAYAVYVASELNAPFLRSGHIVYVDPGRPVGIGHFARVFLLGAAAFLGIVEALTPDTIAIRVLTESEPRVLPRDQVGKIERVVAVSWLEI